MKNIKNIRWLTPLFLSLGLSVILIFTNSETPLETLKYLFTGVFSTTLYWGNFLDRATLLSLSGLSIILAFRSGAFNLGGEGQIYAGGLAVVWLSLTYPNLPSYLGIPLLVSIGALIGFLIALISGILKSYFKIDELISTFLISTGLSQIINYIISGPLHDTNSYLITTKSIPKAYFLGPLLSPSTLNRGTYLVLILIGITYFFLNHTRPGYELSIVGANKSFAHYGGINIHLYSALPIGVSGALNGIVGALAVLGTYHAGLLNFTSGLGWNGIAVALIAGNKIIYLIPAALFFSWINQGASLASLQSSLSLDLGSIIQGILFLLISSQILKKGRQ